MRRRLDAAELADAAATAALVIVLLTAGRLLAAGTLFQVLGTVVFAVLAARRRVRAVAVATVATMTMAVLLGGIGPITQAFVAGLFGACGGVALRRRSGTVGAVGLTVAIGWPVVSAVTLGFLAVFADARRLSFENGRNQWLGSARLLEWVGADGIAASGTDFVDWSIAHWWLMVPLLQLGVSVGYALLVRRLGGAVLRRVDDALGPAWHPPNVLVGDAAPLPLAFAAGVERGNGDGAGRALDIEGRIGPGDRVALLGSNGSGKTTLIESMAGLAGAADIARCGPPGLGVIGGTALIGQAPETQVVGLRVIDDLRWGLDGADPATLQRHLDSVGLGGRDEQPTSQLSGGELQRLAIAAAMARHPRLLLSDESTAMLDPSGRVAVLDLLAGIDPETALVHSTHHVDEVDRLERSVRLTGEVAGSRTWSARPSSTTERLLAVREVGFVHDLGSPWAQRALAGVSFELHRGGLGVVRGVNGSGKTTLVRLLAGLQRPTEGEILLGDAALGGPTPRIGVAFQHARLQLLRPTVAAEVRSSAGTDAPEVIAGALTLAGLDPEVDGRKRVAELSGGQQRRLLLAGLAARRCDVVILDEPLAGLDQSGRGRLTAMVDGFLRQGRGVVVVSHDPAWALDRADVLIDLDPPERGSP